MKKKIFALFLILLILVVGCKEEVIEPESDDIEELPKEENYEGKEGDESSGSTGKGGFYVI